MKIRKASSNSFSINITSMVLLGLAVLAIALLIFQLSTNRLLPSSFGQNPSLPVAATASEQGGLAGTCVADKKKSFPDVVRECDFGDWSYQVGHADDGLLHASVNLHKKTISGLNTYAIANKIMAKQLARLSGPIHVAISFRDYMTADQFRAWAKARGVQVQQAQLSTGGTGPGRVTVGIEGTPDDPLPEGEFNHWGGKDMRGVFGAYATVDASRLMEVASDNNVFLADVTADYIPYDAKKAGLDVKPKDVSVWIEFPTMEELGLGNFALPGSGTAPTTTPATAMPGPVGTAVIPSP
ncbi:MAG: hypothetical protein QOH93_2540 [Chloroflexia bacterium]|nr:hypothetical protein [Chloroflexia bacterium]